MPTGIPKAATRAQVARYGHVAAALREVLKQRGWTVSDLNKAIGRERTYTPPHLWLGAKSAPGPKLRPIVARATRIPEEQLRPRRLGDTGPPPVTTAPVLALAGPPAPPAPRAVMVFAILEDATIEIEMRKLRLPLEEGTALVRMLMDAGVVLRKAP